MENYSYYPESGNSSPRSRDTEYENHPPPWEDTTATSQQPYKVKFMCSSGGKIHPRPHDNQLSYIGGETKILSVDRTIKFTGMISKLSALSNNAATDVSFKYQLPGEDLDALISVTNDDDLEHMMHEFDRLYRGSPKPARMRLFLFPLMNRSEPSEGGFSSGEVEGASNNKTDRDRFVDALNCGPNNQPVDVSSPSIVPNNVDFLLDFDKGGVGVPHEDTKLQEPVLKPPEIPINFTGRERERERDDLFMGSDPVEIQRRIHELQRMQIGGQTMYNKLPKSEDNFTTGDFYAPKFQENLPPPPVPVNIPASVTAPPPAYWPEKHNGGGGGFPATMATAPGHEQQQPMYMFQTTSGGYHAPQMPPRQTMMGQQGNQGYYTVQRMAPEFYREQQHQQQQQQQQQQHQQQQQPVYNVIPPATSAPSLAQVSAAPPRMAVYTEGMSMGMVRPSSGGGVVGVTDTGGYTQVAYDSAGRQVYYTTPGGLVPPQASYQGIAAVSADMRPAGGLSQEGKVNQTSM